jgi:uncharacterized cupin superfamily protein
MKARRVVTGVNAAGLSCVVEEGTPPREHNSAVPGNLNHALMWATEPGSSVPFDGADPTPSVTNFLPPIGGSRCILVEVAPANAADGQTVDPEAAHNDTLDSLPGIGELISEGGFHTTDSVDYSIVISGELHLVLADGSETLLGPGDVVVQNGTDHAWSNKTNEPALFVAILLGATRS